MALKHIRAIPIKSFKGENSLMRQPVRYGVLALAVLFVATLAASPKPNYTGVWERDAKLSDPYTAVVTPIIGSHRDLPGSPFILRVNHRDKHLQIAIEEGNRGSGTTTYDLGRGWHGDMRYEFGGSRYRARWDGDTLTIERYASYRGYDNSTQGSLTQQWILSHEGRVLTITTTAQPGALLTKEVFIRK